MSQDLNALRAHLFSVLQGVKDGTIDTERAKTVNEVAKTLIYSAKVEVDYLKTTGAGESQFIAPQVEQPLPKGILGTRTHRLVG